MRVLGKTGLFGADRLGLGRALAVRGVRGGAAKRGKTNSNQLDNSAKLRKKLSNCTIFKGFTAFRHLKNTLYQLDRKQIYN